MARLSEVALAIHLHRIDAALASLHDVVEKLDAGDIDGALFDATDARDVLRWVSADLEACLEANEAEI